MSESFSFDGPALLSLSRLARRRDASEATILTRALALYELVQQEIADGHRLVLVDEHDTIKKHIRVN